MAAIFSIGMHTLPDYVKKFMVNYPNVNVHIEYLGAEKIYEQVLVRLYSKNFLETKVRKGANVFIFNSSHWKSPERYSVINNNHYFENIA